MRMSKTAPESFKHDGLPVSEAWEGIVWGLKDTIYFIVIHF